MNYRGWTERVKLFSEGLRKLPGEIDVTTEIKPPLDDGELASLAAKWSGRLPESLRRLWLEGSEQISCPYVWTPPKDELPELNKIFEFNDYIYGGARFEPAEEIYPGNSGADPDDELMAETLGQEGFALWCRSAVFLHVGNGDCVGLDPQGDAIDPPVVYLVHDDDESSRISNSLSDFLVAWEQLSFIGPEHWLLDYWLDSETGSIDISKHKTDELRSLLTPRQNKA